MPLVCRNKGRGGDILLILGFQRKPLFMFAKSWLDFYTLYILWLGIIRGCGRTALTMPLVYRNKGWGADIFLILGFPRKPLFMFAKKYSNVSAFTLFSAILSRNRKFEYFRKCFPAGYISENLKRHFSFQLY
jgi:hypothetical protein